ncbi:MAG: hypothetical protein H6673_03665 [Anaerolineales bacterium]|nr:hypothetical protein [Anaerolineales bacterium]
MRKLTILLLLIPLLLIACGGDDDGDTSRSRDLTVPAMPNRTLVDGCPVSDLENWVETAYFNMQSFVQDAEASSSSADDNNRDAIDFVVDRLVLLRNSVNMAVTPDCVADRHAFIVAGMQRVIDDFQLFANAQINTADLKQRVNQDLEEIRQNLDNILTETAPLYQNP